MDAITLLQNDHKKVEALFARFEKLTPRAVKTMRDLNEQIIHELAVHAAIEEQVFYPAVRECVPEADFNVLESLEEHHAVKWTLSELDGMDPEHERFRAKMMVLIESVRHHVEEEEGEVFPQLQAEVAELLPRLGDLLQQRRSELKMAGGPAPAVAPGNGAATAPLLDLTKAELYQRAKAADIPGRSSMNKEELAGTLAREG